VKRVISLVVATAAVLVLSSAATPAARAGDGGSGGGTSYANVPFIGLIASASATCTATSNPCALNPSPQITFKGSAINCTSATAVNALKNNVNNVAEVTCPDGFGGAIVYVALVTSGKGVDTTLVNDVTAVQADVATFKTSGTTANQEAICDGLSKLGNAIADEILSGKLIAPATMDLLIGPNQPGDSSFDSPALGTNQSTTGILGVAGWELDPSHVC